MNTSLASTSSITEQKAKGSIGPFLPFKGQKNKCKGLYFKDKENNGFRQAVKISLNGSSFLARKSSESRARASSLPFCRPSFVPLSPPNSLSYLGDVPKDY